MPPWPSNQFVPEHDGALVDSNEQRRILHEQRGEIDRLAGIELTEEFQRFDQRDDIFTRAFWDPEVMSADAMGFFESYRMKASSRRGEGFSQKDFALRNAAWAVSDMISSRSQADGRREGFQSRIEIDTPVHDEKLEIADVAAFTKEMKHIARLFGADLVGVTEHDDRWLYASAVDTRDFSATANALPAAINRVIILGHAMDRELVDTYPSALAGASTGMEYSHEAAIVIQLASYIRNLGYEAVPSMNDTGLVIPLAVKAGMGEYGRNQMVITPEFGPRLRFSKIYTSLPLELDLPRRQGIAEYCSICTKCAEACPVKALPFGEPDAVRPNRSTIAGVRKWSADCEKCFSYWAKLKSDCAICMRVCPFNRDYARWTARLWRRLATSRFRKLALWWENRFPMGNRLKPRDWWTRQSGQS